LTIPATAVVAGALIAIGGCNGDEDRGGRTTTPAAAPQLKRTPPARAKPRRTGASVTARMRRLRGAGRAHGTVSLTAEHGYLRLASDIFVENDRFGLFMYRDPAKILLLAASYSGNIQQQIKVHPQQLLRFRWVEVHRLVHHPRPGQPRSFPILRVSSRRLLNRLLAQAEK
jgi:hypothetical protein